MQQRNGVFKILAKNNAYYATTFMLYNTTFLVRLSLVDTYFGMFFR